MGSKHAGVHLRCDDSSQVLAKLKKEFRGRKEPDKKDLLALEIIKAFAEQNVGAITDPAEKAEKELQLAEFMEQSRRKMGAGEPAVIVVRRHFVSIYWYDHIRIENLEEKMLEYAYLCGVPAMGAVVYSGE